MKASELRIGDFIISNRQYFDKPTIGKVYTIAESVVWFQYEEDNGEMRGISNPYNCIEGIPLTEEWLIRLGFERLPHFTVTNSIVKSLGRNRMLSVGNVGTGNEIIWLCEINATDPTKIDDLICLRNFDYDGRTYVHQLQNLYFALTGKELTPTPSTV